MELIETGKIVGTHGIAGDVKVQAWADSPDALIFNTPRSTKTMYCTNFTV